MVIETHLDDVLAYILIFKIFLFSATWLISLQVHKFSLRYLEVFQQRQELLFDFSVLAENSARDSFSVLWVVVFTWFFGSFRSYH